MSEKAVPEIERYAASKRIAIDPGTTLHLDFDEGSARTTGELVGMAPGEFLVVKLPAKGDVSTTRMFRGVTMVIRYVSAGTVFAFQCRSLGVVNAPAKLVFISHPTVVAEHNLRAHKRYDCRLPGQVKCGKLEESMVTLNVSAGGCRVTYKDSSQSNSKFKRPSPVKEDAEVELEVAMPGVEQRVSMSGVVKNMRENDGKQELGIAFANLSEDAESQLQSYLELLEF